MVMAAVCAILFHRQQPSRGSAVTLGFCAALACLTRVFSVACLAPGGRRQLLLPVNDNYFCRCRSMEECGAT
jgi:hypothetical protein